MTPIVQLYLIRVVLGIVAGAVTAAVAFFVGGTAGLYDYSTLLNSITVALLIYFVTYYIFRGVYKTKDSNSFKNSKHRHRHVLLYMDSLLCPDLHSHQSNAINKRLLFIFRFS